MTATVTRSGWLEEMTGLYGNPRRPTDLRTLRGCGSTLLEEWRWLDFSVALRTVLNERERPVSSTLRVNHGAVEVEVRCNDGLPADERVTAALRTAGVLPCVVCRSLREVPGERTETGEVWSRCVCTDPSPRPRNGEAVSA